MSFTNPLPGFRDFAPREYLALKYFQEKCREVSRRYGFREYETPLLEPADLYLKKSGGELSGQLFRFSDQGGRDVTLRAEVTASLARLVAKEQRSYPKPLRWFEIGTCFRYEKPQKGRGREFLQYNVDLIGDPTPSADAELIAMAIDTMRAFGFSEKDFLVRLSDRQAWHSFAQEKGLDGEGLEALLLIVDKIERLPESVIEEKLAPLGLKREELLLFIKDKNPQSPQLQAIMEDLRMRGLAQFVDIDLSIVRGLAYYTGVVFEIFSKGEKLRALAGGGRYDKLLHTLTDGKVDLPAAGFAFGDMVLTSFVEAVPQATVNYEAWKLNQRTCDLFLLIDEEDYRPQAISILQDLREKNISVAYSTSPLKFPKQLTLARDSGARYALIFDRDFPQLRLRCLSSKTDESLPPNINLGAFIAEKLEDSHGPLIA